MPEAIEQIVRDILAAPAPVVLPDTCSFLNIMEACILEEKASPNIVPATLEFLLRLSSAPPTLHLAVAEVVREEWLSKHSSKRDKIAAAVRLVDERISVLWKAASAMKSTPTGSCVEFSALRIAERLHDIAEETIGLGKVIKGGEVFERAAGVRMFSNKAPVTAGKDTRNDCLLVEQYFELCRRLRVGGFTGRCIFVTSNTRDFGEPSAPRAPLDVEFAEAGKHGD